LHFSTREIGLTITELELEPYMWFNQTVVLFTY